MIDVSICFNTRYEEIILFFDLMSSKVHIISVLIFLYFDSGSFLNHSYSNKDLYFIHESITHENRRITFYM